MKNSRKGLTMLEVMIASGILVVVVAMVFVIMNNATSQVGTEGANMVMQEKARKLLDDISAELRTAQASSVVPTLPLLNTTFTDSSNGNAITPYDPLGGPPFNATVLSRAKCPLNSSSTAIATGYARYSKIQFDTLSTTSSTTTGAPTNSFDFTSTAPKYTRRVAYTADLDASFVNGGDAVDGIDNNKNILIDERTLWRQEVTVPATIPAVPTATPWPVGTTRVAYNLRNIAFEVSTGSTKNRVLIHVMFQDVDSKGKLIWYYTNTTVSLRN